MSDAPPLHPNAARVQERLAAAGSAARVHQLEASTRTSAEAAAALGVEVGQIGKSLVFLADGSAVVAVLSGTDRCDTAALAAALGATRVDRADADAVRAATGYPIGGVSPVGLPPDVPVLIDPGLAAYDIIWVAAGTPNAVFPTSVAELLRLSGGRSVEVRERRAG